MPNRRLSPQPDRTVLMALKRLANGGTIREGDRITGYQVQTERHEIIASRDSQRSATWTRRIGRTLHVAMP